MGTDADLAFWDGALGAWTANAADGSSAKLSVESDAMRLDFSLGGHGAWAIARRPLVATLPAHYVVVLELRGTATPVQLQFKFVDPSGANVWWWRRPDFTPTADGARIVLRKASLEFAWGPLSGGEPHEVAAIELALAADEPRAGSLIIGQLRLESRDPAAARPRVRGARASSQAKDHPAAQALADDAVAWQPAPGDADAWIDLDLGMRSEFGGVVVDFAGAAPPCRLLASDDGTAWTPLAESAGSALRRCWLRTADGEGRFARVAFAPGATPAIVRADVVPLELALSPSRYIGATARATPRGRYPRHVLGEQAYWAVVTADGDDRKALLSEDGALEVDAESFTLEPFLWTGDRLLTWADGTSEVKLADGHLPVPRVQREVDGLRLGIAAAASGEAGSSVLVARYTVANTGSAARQVRLFVAVRPFQITPAWQSLNLVGGVAPLTRLAVDGATIRVNDARSVVAITPPAAAAVARSAEPTPEHAGEWRHGLSALAVGELPADTSVDDPIGFAEGAFAFDLALAPGASEVVVVALPLHEASPMPQVAADRAAAAAWGARHIEQFTAHWRARLADLPIELPAAAAPFDASLRASLGWILANREGPRIQPGSRCYRRSWIRDGALTGTALTELGFADEARAFLRWYAPYQFADGRVPCAVDHRGIDLAIEHDSHGELAWGVVEVARLTGDVAFLRELWPHVRGAVDAIDALRATRTGAAFRDDPRYGLLPESISHEGYASHPVHSYWDDFFAVLGLAHAADAAALLGEDADTSRIAALRDAMRTDLHASITRVLASQQLDFIPGSVELGDFDPTSTAIAFDPCGEYERLPAAAVARTFERYWAEFDARRRGDKPAEAYTPYEVRTAAAFVMLGQRGRAVEQLAWLIADQRPPAWHQWPEVAWRDPRAPRFIGDLPHGWIASSFVRTVRRMLAYERPDGRALVLAGGVPAEWVRSAPGVRVRGLPTHFGTLDFAMCADGDDRVRVSLGGGLRCPPQGIEIVSPLDRPLRQVEIDGVVVAVTDTSRAIVRSLPADVSLLY